MGVTSSSGVKGLEMLLPSAVGTFHRSITLLTSFVGSRSLVLCASFFTSWEAMEFAETRRVPRPACKFINSTPCLAAGMLVVDGIDSFPSFLHLLSSCESRDEAALSESVPTGFRIGDSNSNCSEGQMRTCTVARGPHSDADAKIAVPEPY